MDASNYSQPSSGQIRQEITKLIGSDPAIRKLSTVRSGPYFLAAAGDWGLIAALACASHYYWHPVLYAFACLLIAGRQHAFLTLAHEAAHYRISTNKIWNDFFSNALFAYPILFDTDGYRQNHLKHHAALNTDEDPDWVRKVKLPQWQFPVPLSFVLKTFPLFVVWHGPKEWIIGMMHLARLLPLSELPKKESLRRVSIRAFYYAALAFGITQFSLWEPVLLYWAVPLVFVFPSLQRVRSVAEHFGLAREHDLNSTRNVFAPWWERLLFGPHNVNYHLDHHLVSSVPFYNLPRLHEVLLANPVYRRLAHENTSYLYYSLRPLAHDLFRKPAEPATRTEKRAA